MAERKKPGIGPAPKRNRLKEAVGMDSPGKPLPESDEFLAEHKSVADLLGAALSTPAGRVMGLTLPTSTAGFGDEIKTGLETLQRVPELFKFPTGRTIGYARDQFRRPLPLPLSADVLNHFANYLPEAGALAGTVKGVVDGVRRKKPKK